jgi:hypothetical protein
MTESDANSPDGRGVRSLLSLLRYPFPLACRVGREPHHLIVFQEKKASCDVPVPSSRP